MSRMVASIRFQGLTRTAGTAVRVPEGMQQESSNNAVLLVCTGVVATSMVHIRTRSSVYRKDLSMPDSLCDVAPLVYFCNVQPNFEDWLALAAGFAFTVGSLWSRD